MATLQLTCPECESKITVRNADDSAGKRVKCPKCGTGVRVPEREEEDDDAPKARGPARTAARRRDEEDDERPARRKRPADEEEDEDERPAARRKRATDDEEAEDERPAARRKRGADDDEDDRPARRKRGRDEDEEKPRKKGQKAGANNAMLIRNVIGGVLLLVAVVLAIVVWVQRSNRDDKVVKKTNNDDEGAPVLFAGGPQPGQQPIQQPFNNPQPGGNVRPPNQFPNPVPNPVPNPNPPPGPPRRDPSLPPVGSNPPVVSDPSPVRAAPAPGEMSADAIRRVKRNTVYIRVQLGDGRQASGSGFVDAGSKLVMTNAHVVGMLKYGDPPPQRVEVVLNSGEGADNEKTLPARIVTVDRSSDLAVLQPQSGVPLPEGLDVIPAKGLLELNRLYVAGFPLGEGLGKEITLSETSVSSLRKNRFGELDRVQVNGGMQPGNSGGPVVDSRGSVVGVAVSGIRGTQINFAIPGERVISVLDGRISEVNHGEPELRNGKIIFRVTVRTIDPLKRIKTVAVDYWVSDAGNPPGPSDQPARLPFDANRQTAAVAYRADSQAGEGEVVLDAVPPAGKVLYFQPSFVNGSGKSRWMGGLTKAIEAPPNPQAIRLVLQHPQGRSVLQLKSKSTYRLKTADGDEHSLMLNLVGRLNEDTQRLPSGGAASVSLGVSKLEMGVSVDGKAPPPSDRAKKIFQDVGKLGLVLRLDGQGNVTDGRSDLRQIPQGSRSALDELADQMLASLDLAAVPIPNAQLKPNQQWRATRKVPIDAGEVTFTGFVDMTYAYLGTRALNGRQVAVIGMHGTLRGVNGKSLQLGGKVRGTALVDVSNGRVVKADTTSDVVLNLRFKGETVETRGTLEVHVSREN